MRTKKTRDVPKLEYKGHWTEEGLRIWEATGGGLPGAIRIREMDYIENREGHYARGGLREWPAKDEEGEEIGVHTEILVAKRVPAPYGGLRSDVTGASGQVVLHELGHHAAFGIEATVTRPGSPEAEGLSPSEKEYLSEFLADYHAVTWARSPVVEQRLKNCVLRLRNKAEHELGKGLASALEQAAAEHSGFHSG